MLRAVADDKTGDIVVKLVNYSPEARPVTIALQGVKKLGNRQMQPGMPAEVIIRTGERSLMKYIIGPLTKRMAASMKEE